MLNSTWWAPTFQLKSQKGTTNNQYNINIQVDGAKFSYWRGTRLTNQWLRRTHRQRYKKVATVLSVSQVTVVRVLRKSIPTGWATFYVLRHGVALYRNLFLDIFGHFSHFVDVYFPPVQTRGSCFWILSSMFDVASTWCEYIQRTVSDAPGKNSTTVERYYGRTVNDTRARRSR